MKAAAVVLCLLSGLLAGCGHPIQPAEAQIRGRILSIRDAIRLRQPEGIVRWGTADWSFTGPDGQVFDRAAYLVRTRALFARIETLDSLETVIDRVEVRGDSADIELSQAMERHERDAASGERVHLRLRYRERQLWVKTDDGWRVRRVAFIGSPERVIVR
jgi:hypothetical protein